MHLNRLVFPAPHSSYTARTLKEQLHWIQRPICTSKGSSSNPKQKIPAPLDISQMKKSSKDIESGKRTTLACTEMEISREICFSGQNIPKEIQSPPKDAKNLNLDLENPEIVNFYDYYGTRTSLNDLVVKEMKGSGKRKKQNVGCFCFFSRAKSDPTGGKSDIGNSQTVGNRRHKRTKSARYIETQKAGSSSQENSKPIKMANIPCLYIKSNLPTSKTLLFFHGNGEDIYLSSELLRTISEYLNVNVLAVEYPGYGIYKGKPSEKNILLDAEAAYNYLLNEMHVSEEDIFVAGRSMGSGPATWLASRKNPAMLIMISPFTSIRAVVKNNFGSTVQYLVKERFNNLQTIPSVKCPVFILHGKKDTLIPEAQAMALYDAVKGEKRIHIAEEMDHGSFDFIGDLIVPLERYMIDLNTPAQEVNQEELLTLEALIQNL